MIITIIILLFTVLSILFTIDITRKNDFFRNKYPLIWIFKKYKYHAQKPNNEFSLNHYNFPLDRKYFDIESSRLTFGETRGKPYNSSILNIGDMNIGNIHRDAITSLSKGSRKGRFSLNTGENGINSCHLNSNDLIWQIGPNYNGCKNSKNEFDINQFTLTSSKANIKMIEIKISDGLLKSNKKHSQFKDYNQLLFFIDTLRKYSDKPIGVKMCVGSKSDFLEFVKTMVNNKSNPDFLTIDNSNNVVNFGMKLNESIPYVNNILDDHRIRRNIKIIASGNINTSTDIIQILSLGADSINMSKQFLSSISYLNPNRYNKKLNIFYSKNKSENVLNFHKELLDETINLLYNLNIRSFYDISKNNIIN